MQANGCILGSGKPAVVERVRVVSVGQVDAAVMTSIVKAAQKALADTGVASAAPPADALKERAHRAA